MKLLGTRRRWETTYFGTEAAIFKVGGAADVIKCILGVISAVSAVP